MVPTIAQINHDLNLLYSIARTIIPKDVLEVLLYGSGFDEPDEEDMAVLNQIIEANREKIHNIFVNHIGIVKEIV